MFDEMHGVNHCVIKPMHIIKTYFVSYYFVALDGRQIYLNISGPYDEIHTKEFTEEDWNAIETAISKALSYINIGTYISVKAPLFKNFQVEDLSLNISGGTISLYETKI